MINLKRFEETAFSLIPQYRGDLRCFHIAGIFKKGKLISLGYNKDTTHPKIKEYQYHRMAGLHAELSACLRGGRDDYSDCEMAVLRIDKNNKLNSSHPCNGCLHCITSTGFKRVYFTNSDGDWLDFKPKDKKVIKKCSRF